MGYPAGIFDPLPVTFNTLIADRRVRGLPPGATSPGKDSLREET
ncbi:MAG: hypothetical protein U5L72_19010 [Bacteroidales bacterium]|nr:hypothetical protein [Bacteroidales bacterium]